MNVKEKRLHYSKPPEEAEMTTMRKETLSGFEDRAACEASTDAGAFHFQEEAPQASDTHDKDADAMPADALRLAAVTPFTTIDFPGKLSAVAFVQGCPWRCLYCHNAWMQPRAFDSSLEHESWASLEALLLRRKGLLDGVVFSGGEPCCDPALPAAVRAVKSMGFLAALHTGGAYPARLRALLPHLDWIGLDVKAPPTDAALYDRVVGKPRAASLFLESFALIQASGVPFECRTTAHPEYLPEEKLLELADWLKANRVETFALQIYRKPPGAFLAILPAVLESYPSEKAREALRGAVKHYIERRE